jgi:hypothetical protein
MNRMVLDEGVVGGLGENTDAWPRPGEDAPRLTGTYLQAWSNTEQLRTWYQYFLGVRPDLVAGTVTLAPRLPRAFGMVSCTARVGEGWLDGEYEIADGSHSFRWRSDGFAGRVSIELPGFESLALDVIDGDRVRLLASGNRMQWHHLDDGLRGRASGSATMDPAALERQARIDRWFEGLGFAKPGDAASLPVMQQAHDGAR